MANKFLGFCVFRFIKMHILVLTHERTANVIFRITRANFDEKLHCLLVFIVTVCCTLVWCVLFFRIARSLQLFRVSFFHVFCLIATADVVVSTVRLFLLCVCMCVCAVVALVLYAHYIDMMRVNLLSFNCVRLRAISRKNHNKVYTIQACMERHETVLKTQSTTTKRNTRENIRPNENRSNMIRSVSVSSGFSFSSRNK